MLDDAEIGFSRSGLRRRLGTWTNGGMNEGGTIIHRVHHRVHKRVEPRRTDDPLYARILDI